MNDYNQQECNLERDITLAECLEHITELATRLQAMAEGDATWPRVGTLMAVRQRLVEVMHMVPPVLPEPIQPLTDAEQVERAKQEGY